MNPKIFISNIKSKRDVVPSKTAYGNLEWNDWYKLANATKYIDYGCEFDTNGVCIEEKDNTTLFNSYTPNPACCCVNCYRNFGYAKRIQDSQKVIKLISSKFKKDVGFWRKGKGCILPRKYRSVVCLGYRCNTIINKVHFKKLDSILLSFIDIAQEQPWDTKTISILGNALIQLKNKKKINYEK